MAKIKAACIICCLRSVIKNLEAFFSQVYKEASDSHSDDGGYEIKTKKTTDVTDCFYIYVFFVSNLFRYISVDSKVYIKTS